MRGSPAKVHACGRTCVFARMSSVIETVSGGASPASYRKQASEREVDGAELELIARDDVLHHPSLHLLQRAIYLVTGIAVIAEGDRSDRADFVTPPGSLAGVDTGKLLWTGTGLPIVGSF